jgi:hypothetical protein
VVNRATGKKNTKEYGYWRWVSALELASATKSDLTISSLDGLRMSEVSEVSEVADHTPPVPSLTLL